MERPSKAMVKQTQVINPRCGVQIFSTVHGCRKHDVKRAISTGVPLTSLTITNSEKFAKLLLCRKRITLASGNYQHVIINL